MATSAFRSTTERTPTRVSSTASEDSRGRSGSLRRSRSLSIFSRPIHTENDSVQQVPDYNRAGPRGKFVNTSRGSSAFPEISLDDLALEFFDSSSREENYRDSGDREIKEREGRSVARWASDTASSRRRGRSVSRSRGNNASCSSSFETKKPVYSSSETGSRRRRSLSLARRQISDSEFTLESHSEAAHRSSRNQTNVKDLTVGKSQTRLGPKAEASSNRRLGRSQSHTHISSLDGYSSHSSALTDDESKDVCAERNEIEKIIQTVYAQKKAEHPSDDVVNGGLYEAMRKELRYAIHEIRTELNQAMGRNQGAFTGNSVSHQDVSSLRKGHAFKFEELEKHKEDHCIEVLLGVKEGSDNCNIVKESPEAKTLSIDKHLSRARKRSSDRNRMSKRLTEEAERYFEGFVSNVDTDISSLDGDRSDESLTLGGKEKNALLRTNECSRTPAGSSPSPVEMDGVHFPWLQWETSHDGSQLGKNSAVASVTPKTLYWDSDKDIVSKNDPSCHSASSHGSWSPSSFSSPDKIGAANKTRQVGRHSASYFDMDEYLKLSDNEELLFEMYRQGNRIKSGSLLISPGIGGLY